MLERINYYEGQTYMSIMGACQNMDQLDKTIKFMMMKSKSDKLASWSKDLMKNFELIGDVAKQMGESASRNYKRCVVSMEVVMGDGQNATEKGIAERASWFQEAASQRLVTCDEDCERFFDAAAAVMQKWPEANSQISELSSMQGER